MPALTQFLNVDLELEVPHSLTPLLAALEPTIFVLHHETQPTGDFANLELADLCPPDAEAALALFCQTLLALPPEARALWDQATVRRFSIGLLAGTVAGTFFAGQLSEKMLRNLTALNARLEVVVYPPEPEDSAPKPPAARRV